MTTDGAHVHGNLEQQVSTLRAEFLALKTQVEGHEHPHSHATEPGTGDPLPPGPAPPSMPWGFGAACNVGRIDRVVEITDGDAARWHAESKVPWTLLLVKSPVTVRTTETFDPAEGVKWWGAPVTLDCRDNTWGVRIRQPHVYGGPTVLIPSAGSRTPAGGNDQASGLIIHPGAEHVFLTNWTVTAHGPVTGDDYDATETTQVWRWPDNAPTPTFVTLDRFNISGGNGSKALLLGGAGSHDMQVTVARTIYGAWGRNPLVTDGAYVHEYNCVRPKGTRYWSAAAERGGRIHSEHTYWHEGSMPGRAQTHWDGRGGGITLGDGTTILDGANVPPRGEHVPAPIYAKPLRESEADVLRLAGAIR